MQCYVNFIILFSKFNFSKPDSESFLQPATQHANPDSKKAHFRYCIGIQVYSYSKMELKRSFSELTKKQKLNHINLILFLMGLNKVRKPALNQTLKAIPPYVSSDFPYNFRLLKPFAAPLQTNIPQE